MIGRKRPPSPVPPPVSLWRLEGALGEAASHVHIGVVPPSTQTPGPPRDSSSSAGAASADAGAPFTSPPETAQPAAMPVRFGAPSATLPAAATTTPPATTPPAPAPKDRRRLITAAIVATAVVVAVLAFVLGVALDSLRSKPQVTASGANTSPTPTPTVAVPAETSSPLEALATATVNDRGVVVLTRTFIWSSVPTSIALEQPQLARVAGVPSGVAPQVGRPKAWLDGQALTVSESGGGWQVQTPPGARLGSVVLTYPVSGTLHRDPSSPPGRALAVIPLPLVKGQAEVPRRLSLQSKNILNVSCPTPGGAVVLCGTEAKGSWLVSIPPDGAVVLAQMDLPGT